MIVALLAPVLSLGAPAPPAPPPPLYRQVRNARELVRAAAAVGPRGGTIILLPGEYELDRPLVFHGVSHLAIRGSGWSTVIRRKGAGDAIVFTGSTWSCSVRHLAIEADATPTSGSGIVFRDGEWCGISVVDDCHIRGFAESGIRFEGNPQKPFSSNTVSRCWLTDNRGDQLYSRANNDFHIVQNQFGAGAKTVPRSGALLDRSSAGTYSMNYHWGNEVALRLGPAANFNRIHNNRFEQSRRNGILVGDPAGGDASMFNVITGNTIHTNSEHNFGQHDAVAAFDAVETTFCQNQIFSWDNARHRCRSGLSLGRGCRRWIVKDNIIRHCTAEPIVFDPTAEHVVRDNLVDAPATGARP